MLLTLSDKVYICASTFDKFHSITSSIDYLRSAVRHVSGIVIPYIRLQI
jgi:hypothetical protein